MHVDMLAGLLCLSTLRLGMVVRLNRVQDLVLCPQEIDGGLVLVGVLVAADHATADAHQVRGFSCLTMAVIQCMFFRVQNLPK